MGRWSERVAARLSSRPSANSAVCAISSASAPIGANGTIGTGSPPDANDPDLVRLGGAAGAFGHDHCQPCDIAEAVASLSMLPCPATMAPERWGQLVSDAHRVASMRWAEAQAAGWSLLEIFGCSPGFARRLDHDGLVMLLNGREVGRITSEHIEIVCPGGDVLRYPRGKGAGAVPIWTAGGWQ